MTGDPPTTPGGARSPEPSIQDLLARALGDQYTIRSLLGRGGFADVFEVWDESLHRRLAVKVLRPDIAWTSGMLARFRQEARALARLTHPNILPIHFVGEGEGLVYYAMPFVEGYSLAHVLRESGALEPERAVPLIGSVLAALQHAHERGLIHRDIKPENVMIDTVTGRTLLVDFGIAKSLDGGAGHTQTGFVVGTPQYMSPEQALGQVGLDARSDLYSVGAMLFQMVTGSPPFDGDTSQEIVAKHISEPAPIPSTVDARVPQWLSDVIVRSLAKVPSDRYQSAEAMQHALRAGLASGSAEAVSADRIVRHLHAADETGDPTSETERGREEMHDDPTDILPAGNHRSEDGSPPSATGGRRRRLVPWIGPVVGVVAIAAVVAYVVARPVLVVENGLVEPITVALNGGEEHVVGPEGEVSLPLERGRPVVARWELVRPTTPSGQGMGVALEGSVVEATPRRKMRVVVDHVRGDSAFFAPLITNATDQPLAVIVNSGLVGMQRCGCTVAPGATRAHVGYYPLYENSSVRVEDPEGRTAIFLDLGLEVSRNRGTVGLRFENRDLQVQPR